MEGSCEFQDELGDVLRKTEVSFVCKVGNSLFVFKWIVRIIVSVSTKSKYSILKYISSLSFG